LRDHRGPADDAGLVNFRGQGPVASRIARKGSQWGGL